MTVMPNTAKKTQLRQEAQARRESAVQAEQRLQALSQEATDLPGKLREAVQQAAKQRAEAARNGGQRRPWLRTSISPIYARDRTR